MRSVRNKSDQLELSLVENSVDVLLLTERWLSEVSVSTFHHLFDNLCFCRDCRRGVLVLLKNKYSAAEIPDINKLAQRNHVEISAVEVMSGYLGIQTSDRKSGILLETLHLVLSFVAEGFPRSSTLLMGDFNVHVLVNTRLRSGLVLLCGSFDLRYLMEEVSRESKSGGTCVDNIFTNANNIIMCLHIYLIIKHKF